MQRNGNESVGTYAKFAVAEYLDVSNRQFVINTGRVVEHDEIIARTLIFEE